MINELGWLIRGTLGIMTVLLGGLVLVTIYQAFHVMCIKKIHYKRYFSTDGVFAGESLRLIEEVTNHFPIPMFSVDIESYVTADLEIIGCHAEDGIQHFISHFRVIWPYTAIRRSYECHAKKRGHYKLESAKVLFAGSDVFLESEAELFVYPKPLELEEEDMVNQYLQYQERSLLPVIPDLFSFAGIREYRPTDSFRSINFKATARRDEWMVNETEYLLGKQCMIYLNFQSEGLACSLDDFTAIMEKALSYVSYLFAKSMEQGCRFGFGANCRMSNNAYYMWHPLGMGSRQYEAILKEMAMVRPVYGNSFRSVLAKDIETGMTNAQVTILTSYMDEGISDAIEILSQMGNQVQVIMLEDTLENR